MKEGTCISKQGNRGLTLRKEQFTPGRESDHTDELDSDCEMLEDCSLSCIQMDINGMGAEESSGGFQFIF